MEFAATLPPSLKLRGLTQKYLLKRVMADVLPASVMRRRKMGFGVPIDTWLRGPLRGWAEDLLAPDLLTRDGYLDAAVVRETWARHLSGAHNEHYPLWHVLMFQAWLHA
jgi:asparagine synthase (glutamine-hydrolysing)